MLLYLSMERSLKGNYFEKYFVVPKLRNSNKHKKGGLTTSRQCSELANKIKWLD